MGLGTGIAVAEAVEKAVDVASVAVVVGKAGYIGDTACASVDVSVNRLIRLLGFSTDLITARRSIVGKLLLWETLLRKNWLRKYLSRRWTKLAIYLRRGGSVAVSIARRGHTTATCKFLLRPELLVLLLLKESCPSFNQSIFDRSCDIRCENRP